MASWTIGELATQGGVGVETIRFYQRRGLLPVPPRGAGIRRYGGDVLRRLRFIRAAQAAGFTLEEIRELLALDATEERARVRALALARVAALEARLAELAAARDALRRLVGQCAEGRAGPCPILGAFEA